MKNTKQIKNKAILALQKIFSKKNKQVKSEINKKEISNNKKKKIKRNSYGFPFYAGWGLTLDKLNKHNWAKRRTRRLSLEELIFISLVKYPLYSSLKFDCFLEIENVIEEVINSNSTKRNLEQMIFKYWGILKDRFSTLKN